MSRTFDLRQICREQEIGVTIPENTFVEASEVDELFDMALKLHRLFNRIDKIKQMSMAELQFAMANNNQIRSAEFTNNITVEVNDAYKYLDSPSGVMGIYKKLSSRTLSEGYGKLRYLISGPINISFTHLKSILVHLINTRALYETHGSTEGYLPYLDLKGATTMLEKTIGIENCLYDAIYIVGTILLTSLKRLHGKDTPVYLKRKLKEYELYEGEGDATLNRMLTSFNPEARFALDNDVDIIFNF